MYQRDLFRSPFPPFDLTPQEKEDLHDMAIGQLDDAQAEFEHFLWERESAIDLTRWRLLRERENLRAFVDKRPGGGTGNPDMKLMLVVGTIPGALNDVMYGELNHTTDDLRVRAYYSRDTNIDGAVLASILEPTMEEPFQSMTLRWTVKGMPLPVRVFSKHNDGTFVGATGIRELSNGEQVGFMMMHTIDSSKMPPLPQYDRLHGSVRTLYRQYSPNVIQRFTLIYVEVKESVWSPILPKALADVMLYGSDMVHTGQKLVSLVRRKASLTEREGSEGDGMEDGCSVCSSKSRSARCMLCNL